jgi:hypothetical protein
MVRSLLPSVETLEGRRLLAPVSPAFRVPVNYRGQGVVAVHRIPAPPRLVQSLHLLQGAHPIRAPHHARFPPAHFHYNAENIIGGLIALPVVAVAALFPTGI